MSAGKPNWGRLASLGRLPQEQRHNLPGAEEIEKIEAENAELKKQNAPVSEQDEVVEQPGSAPLREEGSTSHLESSESSTGEAGSVDEESNEGVNADTEEQEDNEVTSAVTVDPGMKRNQLESIAIAHTTIQDASDKGKYPNKAVLYEAIVEELELK